MQALAALFTPGIIADPYPVYARWRAERPVARPREQLYVLSRFADCEAVLADPAFGRAEDGEVRPVPGRARAAGRGGDEAFAGSMLRLNPPDHTRLRRLVSRAFTPARVRELAPRIEALTAELLDGAVQRPRRGRFDLISGLALPLPVAVISELLGIPPGDRPRLVAWSRGAREGPGPGIPHLRGGTRAAAGRRARNSPPTCAGCCRRGAAPPAPTSSPRSSACTTPTAR